MTTLVSNQYIYIAKSTDIDEDNVLAGGSIIGAKVFVTDTQEWYIIDEDLILQPYLLLASQTVV